MVFLYVFFSSESDEVAVDVKESVPESFSLPGQ